MTLSAEEFIRRFLMHLLPPGFMKVRTAGFLSGRVRKKYLSLIHRLLHSEYQESPVKKMSSADLILHFYGRNIKVCDYCQGTLEIVQRLDCFTASRFIRAS